MKTTVPVETSERKTNRSDRGLPSFLVLNLCFPTVHESITFIVQLDFILQSSVLYFIYILVAATHCSRQHDGAEQRYVFIIFASKQKSVIKKPIQKGRRLHERLRAWFGTSLLFIGYQLLLLTFFFLPKTIISPFRVFHFQT